MDDARERKFDALVVEALDRLSRDMEDLAGIHKRLSFLGIEIRAVHEGVVNTVLVGLRGLVGQLYREDNAHKVRGVNPVGSARAECRRTDLRIRRRARRAGTPGNR